MDRYKEEVTLTQADCLGVLLQSRYQVKVSKFVWKVIPGRLDMQERGQKGQAVRTGRVTCYS